MTWINSMDETCYVLFLRKTKSQQQASLCKWETGKPHNNFLWLFSLLLPKQPSFLFIFLTNFLPFAFAFAVVSAQRVWTAFELYSSQFQRIIICLKLIAKKRLNYVQTITQMVLITIWTNLISPDCKIS